jgi:GNAT superfamily N-acetyltransferase
LIVTLAPLGDEEYRQFAAAQVVEYARQMVNGGDARPDQGELLAQSQLWPLTDDRLRGHGHDFWKAVTPDGARVAWVWIAPAPGFVGAHHLDVRWLSQITVEEKERGRGVGRAVMQALEAALVAAGVTELWLRVYDWNVAARGLYASLGFVEVTKFANDAHWKKRLTTA